MNADARPSDRAGTQSTARSRSVRSFRLLPLFVLMAGLFFWTGCDSGGSEVTFDETSSLADILKSENLTRFREVLSETDQLDALKDTTSTYMVFAPVNTAFDSLDADFLRADSDRLGSVARYHIVEGTAVPLDSLSGGETFTTLQGDEIQIGDGMVQRSEIIVDVEAANGVIFTLDEILLKPLTLNERLKVTTELSTRLSTFKGILDDIGRTDALNDESTTYTIFVPSNAAFKPYDTDVLSNKSDLLRSVVDYHILKDTAVTADEFNTGESYTTVQGDEVTVTGKDAVEYATFSEEVSITNGAIHVVDDVLLTNRTLTERFQVTKKTRTFYENISSAGVTGAFADSTVDRTVFAPANQDFEQTDLSGFSDEELQQILEYHILGLDIAAGDGLLVSELENNDGETSLPTVQGENVKLTLERGSIILNDGQATLNREEANTFASTGIFHMIDGVLIPPSLQE